MSTGDPAEDFRWQMLAGPTSPEYHTMADGYASGGGTLGVHAVERLVVAGVKACLDVLGWTLPPEEAEHHHPRCIATLEELVAGHLPEPPSPRQLS